MPRSGSHILGANGEPTEDNFGYEKCPYPSEDLQQNEVLVKTCYLSVDPALRCMMNEDTGVDYAPSWQIGKTVTGASGLGVVIKSDHPNYQPGDLLIQQMGWPWAQYLTINVETAIGFLQKVDMATFGERISLAVSLPLVGLTALLGIREKGHVTRGANQTCVVSGAAGATGSLAGQIAQLEGCSKVVGICGTKEKCDWLTGELGFNHAINYKTDDIAARLKETCHQGIDVYFDNVGGDISDIVFKQMTGNSHVILCGQISQYNKDVPYPPPIPENMQKLLQDKNITRERFLVLNYVDKFEEGVKELVMWALTGQLKMRETIAEGLENAGKAFVSMMAGGNLGKQLVLVADPSSNQCNL